MYEDGSHFCTTYVAFTGGRRMVLSTPAITQPWQRINRGTKGGWDQIHQLLWNWREWCWTKISLETWGRCHSSSILVSIYIDSNIFPVMMIIVATCIHIFERVLCHYCLQRKNNSYTGSLSVWYYIYTGSLEVYHQVMLKYAEKRLDFSYDSMRARTHLAIVDHNCNVGRPQAKTLQGII